MGTSLTPAGRAMHVTHAAIAGLVSCLPQQIVPNSFFTEKFDQNTINDVIKIIGVKNRHWCHADTSTVDLCNFAAHRLLQELDWSPDSVDAIIFVSQTPNYRLPASACVLQKMLGLSNTTIAFDINLGCSAYPYALWLGMTMVQSGAARRVLLAVGDTISKIVDPSDRATALLFGDAGTVTAIEARPNQKATFVLGTDGAGYGNLIVPRGAFKKHLPIDDQRLSNKSLDHLYMDGGEIFNFTLRAVPSLVSTTIATADKTIESYDKFLFHQANLFMLKHLIKKTKLPLLKVPINIEDFGNTSSASIPLLMSTNLREDLKKNHTTLAMFGFGVGYSWGGVSIEIEPLTCVETVYL